MIFGISGYAGTGKDSFAIVLGKVLEEVSPVPPVFLSLAWGIKRFCCDVLGASGEQMYGPSEKRAEIDPLTGLPWRTILQTLGTEWGRHLHPDIWIRLADRIIAQHTFPERHFIIPDVRFKNEFEWIKRHPHGGITIRVWRQEIDRTVLPGGVMNHCSETDLDDVPPSQYHHHAEIPTFAHPDIQLHCYEDFSRLIVQQAGL